MAKFNFYLRDKKVNGETPITLFISFNDLRIKYPTGKVIHPKFWNDTDQFPRNVKEFLNGKLLGASLRQIRETAEATLMRLEMELGRFPSKNELIAALDKEFLPTKQEESIKPKSDLLSVFNQFIQESISGERLDDSGKRFHQRTIQKYKTTYELLKKFNALHKLSFEGIDQQFYSKFLTFLNKKEYVPNTIGKHVQVIKTFLNYATEKGFSPNQFFRSKKFKAFKEPGFSIYLNKEEIDSIKSIDLSSKPHLDRVRDLFLVGCWTGLRFSDFTTIKQEYIDGDLLTLNMYKGKKPIVVPIFPEVKEILKKNEGKFSTPLPKAISNQKLNQYLKEIAQLSPLLQITIEEELIKGGKPVTEKFQKWQLVTSHTARRSFATNMYRSGFPALSLMKITGHRTEKAFLLYIKMTPEENALQLLEHWKRSNEKN